MKENPWPPGTEYEEQPGNSGLNDAGEAIYAYNVNDGETPGGLKVRWKIRVITGPPAARLDARQAEAIRELLLWARQYSQPR